jgi:hypothetical protein
MGSLLDDGEGRLLLRQSPSRQRRHSAESPIAVSHQERRRVRLARSDRARLCGRIATPTRGASPRGGVRHLRDPARQLGSREAAPRRCFRAGRIQRGRRRLPRLDREIERRHFNAIARQCGFGADMESIIDDVVAKTPTVIETVGAESFTRWQLHEAGASGTGRDARHRDEDPLADERERRPGGPAVFLGSEASAERGRPSSSAVRGGADRSIGDASGA